MKGQSQAEKTRAPVTPEATHFSFVSYENIIPTSCFKAWNHELGGPYGARSGHFMCEGPDWCTHSWYLYIYIYFIGTMKKLEPKKIFLDDFTFYYWLLMLVFETLTGWLGVPPLETWRHLSEGPGQRSCDWLHLHPVNPVNQEFANWKIRIWLKGKSSISTWPLCFKFAVFCQGIAHRHFESA